MKRLLLVTMFLAGCATASVIPLIDHSYTGLVMAGDDTLKDCASIKQFSFNSKDWTWIERKEGTETLMDVTRKEGV